jgi:hypothetical protein
MVTKQIGSGLVGDDPEPTIRTSKLGMPSRQDNYGVVDVQLSSNKPALNLLSMETIRLSHKLP